MKIAITGSGGTGKTTLAKALAERLGLPYVSEGVRSYMAANGITHLRELDTKGTIDLQEKVLSRKIALETEHESFVADRTSLDNIAYCLRWLSGEDGIDEWMQEYILKAMDHAATYDLIFVAPWGVIPLEDDGVRSSKQFYQLEIQLLLERLALTLREEGHPGIYFLGAGGVEARIAEITEKAVLFSRHGDGDE